MGLLDYINNLIHGTCRETERKLRESIELLTNQFNSCSINNSNLNTELASLKKDYSSLQRSLGYSDPPTWLNTSDSAYTPKVEVMEKSGTLKSVELQPQDIYATSPSLEEVVESHKWREMSHNKKILAIWDYVIKQIRYQYDYVEFWHFPVVTFYRLWGDCEDGTILFITLCKMSGVPSDKVFNACGWYRVGTSNIGHSYPIGQMEDGLWYIFETTLDNTPNYPKIFKGSNYTADWGLANWEHNGKIKHGNQI